jgi:hypothetical protein
MLSAPSALGHVLNIVMLRFKSMASLHGASHSEAFISTDRSQGCCKTHASSCHMQPLKLPQKVWVLSTLTDQQWCAIQKGIWTQDGHPFHHRELLPALETCGLRGRGDGPALATDLLGWNVWLSVSVL